MEYKGIDVSSIQGKPDWAEVAAYGMDFAILRVHQKYGIDSSFEYNYKNCKSNGIPIGAYKYSYALNATESDAEAKAVLEVLNGRGLDFPVFLDLEWDSQEALGKTAIERIALTFLNRIEKAGYKVGIYCNLNWYNNLLTDKLKKYDCWVANYPNEKNDNGTLQERLRPTVGVGWQYSAKASIPGIDKKVDRDIFLKNYSDDDNKKEDTTVTKLKTFIELGNYYANAVDDFLKPYVEKRTAAYLDDFQKNAGSNNYQKFSRDVNNWGQPGCQAQPWCATYQFWKLVNVLGITRALQIMGGGFYNCDEIKKHAKANGTWHDTPKDGALVIFRNGAHIASVNSFTGSKIYTNEGNTSSKSGVIANGGAVRNKEYSRSSSDIDGYVWINWGTGQAASTTWKATGTATANVSHLYVRETPNGYVMGELMKGNRFEINGEISGTWTKVSVANVGIGWVATKYITKDGEEPAATKIPSTTKQDKTKRLFVGRVNASLLNVRTWAGLEYPTIKKWPQLSKGNMVDVMNFTQKDTKGESWYYVKIAGKYFGFVKAEFIDK